ncbi:hypothetical protein B0J14DRAFT_606223 [Halenospora varia]|nr:hypothetical protein B0J14DRAFT_606223 [Halenospora varia]
MAYVCPYCKHSFSRSDVRRLHYQSCKLRILTGACMPPAARQGRKLRACDACARRKRACDKKQPCSHCENRRVPCTYTRQPCTQAGTGNRTTDTIIARSQPLESGSESEVASRTPWPTSGSAYDPDTLIDVSGPLHRQDQDQASLSNTELLHDPAPSGTLDTSNSSQQREQTENSWLLEPDAQALPRSESSTLAFLHNFTSSKGILARFEFSGNLAYSNWQESVAGQLLNEDFGISISQSAWAERFSLPSDENLTQPPQAGTSFYSQTIPWWHFEHPIALGISKEAGVTSASLGQIPTALFDVSDSVESINISDWITDPLFPQSRNILLKFQQINLHDSLLTDSATSTMSPVERNLCLTFFSPKNIERLLESFWDGWNPHCPVVHYPTFEPVTASVPLLIIMVLLGASVSPNSRDLEMGRQWFDRAEHIAFQELATHQKAASSNSQTWPLEIEKPAALQAAFFACCLQTFEGGNVGKKRVRRHRYNLLVDVARDIGFDQASHRDMNPETLAEFNWKQYVAKEELIRTFTYIVLVDSSFVIFNNSPARVLLQELRCGLLSPPACFQAENPQECYQHLQTLCPRGSLRARITLCEAVELLRNNVLDEAAYSEFMNLDSLNLFSVLSALVLWVFRQDISLINIPGFEAHVQGVLCTWALFWSARSDQYIDLVDKTSPRAWSRNGFFKFADEYRQFAVGLLQLRVTQQHLQLSGQRPNMDIISLPKCDETSMDQVKDLLDQLQCM